MGRRTKETFDSAAVQLTHIPNTKEKLVEAMQKADLAWNVWASRNREQRERYEGKFMEINKIKDPYSRRLFLENLCLHEERPVFMDGAKLWSHMVQLHDAVEAYDARKLIVDPKYNDEEYWVKILDGLRSPIHHNYEPPTGTTVFLPNEISPTPKAGLITDSKG